MQANSKRNDSSPEYGYDSEISGFLSKFSFEFQPQNPDMSQTDSKGPTSLVSSPVLQADPSSLKQADSSFTLKADPSSLKQADPLTSWEIRPVLKSLNNSPERKRPSGKRSNRSLLHNPKKERDVAAKKRRLERGSRIGPNSSITRIISFQ